MTDKADAADGIELGRASAWLASGTLVSRILGFVYAIVLAAAIGYIGAAADGFTLATQIPNSIYALIAGGLLSAVLVPQIVRAGVQEDGGAQFINKIVTLGTVILLLVAIGATLAAPALVRLYVRTGADGLNADELSLATAFAFWCLPQIFFYGLYSLLGQVLNARKVFGPFTWAPAANNLVGIAGVSLFIVAFGADPAHREAFTWTVPMVALLGGTATAGIAVQALVLPFFWRRAGLRFRADFRWRGVGLRRTGQAASWVFGMILLTQLAAIVETRVATIASGQASLGVLKYAWLIFMLPHSIVTVSIATAYFTRMSTHARDGELSEVAKDVSSSLRAILMVMVFAAAGLIVIAYPFAAVFGGAFNEIQALANVATAYLLGLIPFTILFVIQRVFYSLDDTRTPFFLQLFQSVLFVIGVLLVSLLPTDRIAIGIALVMTVSVAIQTVAASGLARRRLTTWRIGPLVRELVLFAAAAGVAAGIGFLSVSALGGYSPDGFGVDTRVGAAITMVVAGLAMGVVYFAVLAITRNRTFSSIVTPLVARLRSPKG